MRNQNEIQNFDQMFYKLNAMELLISSLTDGISLKKKVESSA